jgi:GAF domain-containing protein
MSMLGDDGQPTTGIYTDPTSPAVDEAQYRSGRGPCLDAWRQQSPVRIDDITDPDTPYPEFTEACLQHGILSTLSLPLSTAGRGIGALNLYARQAHAFTGDDAELGSDIAAAAAVVLVNVSAYWTAFDLSANLGRALETRGVIDQAKGMLMAGDPELTPDGAFDLLRRASQREHVKLHEIASRIVGRDRVEAANLDRPGSDGS